MISSFSNFYNNLSSNGLFFFWIAVFLFVFVIFLVVVLILKNKKLSKYLKESKTANNIPVKEDNKDNDNILSSSLCTDSIILTSDKRFRDDYPFSGTEDKEKDLPKEEDKSDNGKTPKEIVDKKEESRVIDSGLYKKNVLRDTRRQTSPISIDNSSINDTEYIDKEYFTDTSYNKSPLEELEDVYEVNDSMKFASTIVDKMEEEIKPSNIELTDYEKKQEEEAIISYDELLKVKDKIYNITDDEETDDFIDELKSFRIDLQ